MSIRITENLEMAKKKKKDEWVSHPMCSPRLPVTFMVFELLYNFVSYRKRY